MSATQETKLEGVHSSMTIARPAPGIVVLTIEGADVGELGERPFRELASDVEAGRQLQLFVDARAATGPSIEVGGHWAGWLQANQLRLDHVTMLPGSRFVKMTAEFVRDFSGLREKMRIFTDAAAFDETLRSACTVAHLTEGPRGFPVWEELYQTGAIEKLPWYCAVLDPDLERALARYGVTSGHVLDLGTGPGTQAIALAERGFAVSGTDVSSAAVAYAAAKAKAKGVAATFARDDVLATAIAGPFDVIFDRGCFHVFPPEHRAGYVDTLHRWLKPSGYLFLKTFSVHQPGTQGPYRFARDDIRRLFADNRFEVLEFVDTVFQGQLDPFPKALFTVMRRR